MSAQRAVSSSSTRRAPLSFVITWFAVALVAGTGGYLAGWRAGASREVMSGSPPGGRSIAFVRERSCSGGVCQTLWLGESRESATELALLRPGERCEEISWASDGYRMGFLINGYLLRVFDVKERRQAAQVTLFQPDATPSSHVARGVTFSTNGAAVTFDNCPRYSSGCKSGFAAVR